MKYYPYNRTPIPFAELHERTRRIYHALCEYKEAHNGNSPSHLWLRNAVGLRSVSAIKYHLRILQENGYVEIEREGGFGIVVVGGQWTPPERREQPCSY